MSGRGRGLGPERGAVMLVGACMAVFLVGCVYYVVGIGEAIAHKERMQDAADAAAFSAAVVQARGMNFIVLINVVMSALLAILVALKLLETAIGIAIVILLVASIFNPGAAAVVPLLNQARSTVSQTHQSLFDPVMSMLRGLNQLAGVVRTVMPTVAQAQVLASVARDQGEPVRFGFALPGSLRLPVEDDDFPVLCRRAEEHVADLALLPAQPILGSDGFAYDALHEAIEGLASVGTGWYCGPGGGESPSYSFEYDRVYPELPAREECRRRSARGEHGASLEVVCSDADQAERLATPDPHSGLCRDDCGGDGPYALRMRLARQDCQPEPHAKLGQSSRKDYHWVERRAVRRYRRLGTRTLLVDTKYEPSRLVRGAADSHEHPCGHGGVVSQGYRLVQDWSAPPQAMPAVCERELPRAGEPLVRDVVEVRQVLGCTARVTETRGIQDFQQDPTWSDGGKRQGRRSPQRLQRGHWLGQEDFQVRAVVVGTEPSAVPERVLQLASWGGRPGVPSAASLGRLAMAQAEYYFDDGGDASRRTPNQWLWHMGWKARLRRLRLPDGLDLGAAAQSCRTQSGRDTQGCDSLLGRLGGVGDGLLH